MKSHQAYRPTVVWGCQYPTIDLGHLSSVAMTWRYRVGRHSQLTLNGDAHGVAPLFARQVASTFGRQGHKTGQPSIRMASGFTPFTDRPNHK